MNLPNACCDSFDAELNAARQSADNARARMDEKLEDFRSTMHQLVENAYSDMVIFMDTEEFDTKDMLGRAEAGIEFLKQSQLKAELVSTLLSNFANSAKEPILKTPAAKLCQNNKQPFKILEPNCAAPQLADIVSDSAIKDENNASLMNNNNDDGIIRASDNSNSIGKEDLLLNQPKLKKRRFQGFAPS